jgi:hypothetical protein
MRMGACICVHSAKPATPWRCRTEGSVQRKFEIPGLHKGSPRHSNVQGAVSGFHAAGGSGRSLQSDDSQANSVSAREDVVYHGIKTRL